MFKNIISRSLYITYKDQQLLNTKSNLVITHDMFLMSMSNYNHGHTVPLKYDSPISKSDYKLTYLNPYHLGVYCGFIRSSKK